jgi:hypothetical protein
VGHDFLLRDPLWFSFFLRVIKADREAARAITIDLKPGRPRMISFVGRIAAGGSTIVGTLGGRWLMELPGQLPDCAQASK